MSRFFRRLRKKLIEEEKVRKYFYYAIGEILLIVIGIIIALQINNWNEFTKLQKEILRYTAALKDDLKQDSLLISYKVNLLTKDTVSLGGLLRKMSSNEVSLDTLIRIGRYEYTPATSVTVAFNNNTITSLRSTGNFSHLSESLQSDLLKLIELQQRYKSATALNLQAYLDQAISYTRKYPFPMDTHISPDSKLSRSIWKNAKFEEYGARLNGLISVKYALEKNSIKSLVKIQERTNTLLQNLNQHLYNSD